MKKYLQIALILIILLLATVYTGTAGTFLANIQGFHSAAGEWTVESSVADNTLNLDWDGSAEGEMFTVLYGDSMDTIDTVILETESLGLSLSPAKKGYYKVVATSSRGQRESEAIPVMP